MPTASANAPLSFRALCHDYLNYTGDALYRDVLEPQTARARESVAALSRYREFIAPANGDDLCEWYALSRLFDFLIAGLPLEIYYPLPDRQSPRIALEEHEAFFVALGFTPIQRKIVSASEPFHPFFHEIVSVIEDADATAPTVDREYWRGFLWGRMIFARAGVAVRCPVGYFDKHIAETSFLYFAYHRRHRQASDLSHGWGSNSQWSTHFRRDYHTGEAFHFNVDGRYPLGDEAAFVASLSPHDRAWYDAERGSADALTMGERVELLTHRSFVRCGKDGGDRFPFNDRYTVLKSEGVAR